MYDKTFKSVEHAYFYYMACEMGRSELAEEIQEAEHAEKVKHLSKGIADDTERWQWESENTDVMREILEVKADPGADQCEQFRQCLLENCDTVLAEATPSKIWASGLCPWATEHTDPSYWPGKNMLGAILMEISAKLSAKLSSEHSGEPMQTGTVSVEDSSNQQEDTDDETETTEADFFDAETDTEVENKLETQYPSSTHDEKSSPSCYAENTPPAPNNTPESDTNNKEIKQSKNTQNKTNQRKNNPKKSITKGDKSKKVWSKKDAPKTPRQQEIMNVMKPIDGKLP